MANIVPDSIVTFSGSRLGDLNFPPDVNRGMFAVAVHRGALKDSNESTQIIQVEGGEILWVGAVDESMVKVAGGMLPQARKILAGYILSGSSIGDIVKVELLNNNVPYLTTIYQGRGRPWVVVGETPSALLAAPLNYRAPGERIRVPYQVEINEAELQSLKIPAPTDSKLEMNHVWSLPKSLPRHGSVDAGAHLRLTNSLRGYYRL